MEQTGDEDENEREERNLFALGSHQIAISAQPLRQSISNPEEEEELPQ